MVKIKDLPLLFEWRGTLLGSNFKTLRLQMIEISRFNSRDGEVSVSKQEINGFLSYKKMK